MRIVIWKSYGEISVYEAQTADQLEKINLLIMSCLDRYGLDVEISLLKKKLDNYPGDYTVAREVFYDLENLLTSSHDDDNFEKLEFTETKEPK